MIIKHKQKRSISISKVFNTKRCWSHVLNIVSFAFLWSFCAIGKPTLHRKCLPTDRLWFFVLILCQHIRKILKIWLSCGKLDYSRVITFIMWHLFLLLLFDDVESRLLDNTDFLPTSSSFWTVQIDLLDFIDLFFFFDLKSAKSIISVWIFNRLKGLIVILLVLLFILESPL